MVLLFFILGESMSRSRKKHPWASCIGDKSNKKLFNRKFRHTANLDFPSGGAYKKTNDSYEICEFKVYGEDWKDDPELYRRICKK